jgi:hypothetical protein
MGQNGDPGKDPHNIQMTFDKSAKATQPEEDSLFKMELEQLDTYRQEKNLYLNLTSLKNELSNKGVKLITVHNLHV